MEQLSCVEEIRVSENPPWYGINPKEEELRDDLRGESDGSQPIDTVMDDREARNVFWSIVGNYIYRHHVEPRVQLHVPDQENACDLGCVARKSNRLWTMDGFQAAHKNDWKTCWRSPGGGLLKFSQPQDLIICGQKCGPECQKQHNERKSSSGQSWNRRSTMRESREASFLLIRMTRSSKKPFIKRTEKVGTSNGSRYAL